MWFAAKHADTLGSVADACRDDIVIEGGCRRDECAPLYCPPDADLPEQEVATT